MNHDNYLLISLSFKVSSTRNKPLNAVDAHESLVGNKSQFYSSHKKALIQGIAHLSVEEREPSFPFERYDFIHLHDSC